MGNADGKVVFEIDLDTKGFDEEIKNTEAKLKELIEEYKERQGFEDTPSYKKMMADRRNEIEKTRNSLVDLKKKQLSLNEGTDDGVDGLKDLIKKAFTGFDKITKKAIRYTVALFGIRSAYTAIRQAMSTITQYDKQMKSDIDYMRYAVAMTLKPIIEWIINAIYKLMQYINYISVKWFGFNLFQDAGADAFKKANKSAKEYQKTLAGFDEMDILKTNKKIDEINPQYDLSKTLTEREVPSWLKWIGDHKDVFQIVLEGFAILFGAKAIQKILDATKFILGTKSVAGSIGTGLFGVYTMLLLIGAVTFTQLYKSLKEAIKLTKELNTEIQQAISNQITYQKKRAETNEQVWKEYEAGNVNSDTMKAIISTYINSIERGVGSALKAKSEIGTFANAMDAIFGGTNAQDLKKLMIENLYGVIEDFNSLKKAYEFGLVDPSEYKDVLRTINGIYDELKSGVNAVDKSGRIIGLKDEKYGKEVNDFLEDISKELSELNKNAIHSMNQGFLELTHSIGTKKNAIGGIINYPGHGVSLGYSGGYNQIGGEAGYEGLIPMDNASQMEMIGRAVAKYTVINLTNITKLDNREIAREQRRVSADNDFAYNR